jgi:hypothetical protein
MKAEELEQLIIQLASVLIPAASAVSTVVQGIAARRGQTVEEICGDTAAKSDALRGRLAADIARLQSLTLGKEKDQG